ncbi:hypothetical protein CDD81_6470 [Ophiocordyceps australis]|uniref:Cytochrome P450 n=1 Tax=Ophiocordyceps australis TaxID=1399860 RepID=A0A2C5YG92_9HYPO|nr:hypothetical protein CDD81_6470 [Ophiocordyceps australis]
MVEAEQAALVGWVASGGLVAWWLAWRLCTALGVVVMERQPLATWSQGRAAVALGAALACLWLRSRHRYLRGMRRAGAQPGRVYRHGDVLLGTDLVRKLLAAAQAGVTPQFWHAMLTAPETRGTCWVNAMGHWDVMTNEPENIKTLLASHFDAWDILGLRQKATALVLGPNSIFSANGQVWAQARAMMRPSFVRNQIADLGCTNRHVDAFLARMPRDGATVDVQDLLFMFTMDLSTDFMFGYSTSMLVKPNSDAVDFSKSFDYALYESASRARLGMLERYLPKRKLQQTVRVCRAFIDRHVAAALERGRSNERPYVFMNEMIESGASHEQITEQLLAMILGGRDTSAATLSAMFWILARRPDVVRAIRAELQEFGGCALTWDELRGLKYLNNVLKETLRLWGPVPFNSRQATRDTVLPKGGGPDGQSPLFILKGTSCRYSPWSMHRRKDIYGDDADEFRPDRWETLRVSWEYLPFSGGPRICIGQQFAITTMLALAARFWQTFEAIEARDDRPMLYRVSTTTSLMNGCLVGLTPA